MNAPDFAPYRRLVAQRQRVLQEGNCTCCAVVEGRTPPRAVARWYSTNGAVSALCLDCLTVWLEDLRPECGGLEYFVRLERL